MAGDREPTISHRRRMSANGVELALEIDALVAEPVIVALGARDAARHRWRDGWLLELVRGEERWPLEPGGSITIHDARPGPIVALLRVRRRCMFAGDLAANIALVDAGFHRYTLQSSAIDVTGAKRPAAIPWMTPTRSECAPWWQIDLGKPMCIVWMRIDLALRGHARHVPRVRAHPRAASSPSSQPRSFTPSTIRRGSPSTRRSSRATCASSCAPATVRL